MHTFCFLLQVFLYLFHRLVNENEVKQWKEQAEKMRKGKWPWQGEAAWEAWLLGSWNPGSRLTPVHQVAFHFAHLRAFCIDF
jgi:hypothetical protein